MVLNSGEILGSTPNRIQIASADDDTAVIPGEGQSSPIVLQGRYIQLLDDSSNQLGGRAYVETYDATYGHVYPIAGSFTNDLIAYGGLATKCRFYKYTNDPDSVLPTDGKVKVATNGPISSLSGLTVDGVALQNGDLVLVKDGVGGSSPYDYTKNGIYRVATGTWSRDASFDSWGDFIGKYIYVESGTYTGKNFQSLAAAGGTLWVSQSSAGASELFFVEEQPITIFGNTVQGTATVITLSNPGSSTLQVDSYTLKAGDTVLYYSSGWHIKKVIAVTSSTVTYGDASDVANDTN